MKTTPTAPHAAPDLGEIATRSPIHVWFEPTDRCNTRCIHCGHYYRRFGKDMDLGLYEKIAAAVLDDLERVELIGYGEPLMAAHFQRMFDDCAERGIEIFTTTNGILLRNDDLVSKIVRNRVVLCLSIDGARAETFETVRPYIKWPKLIETLECIKRNADAAGPEKRFRLRFNFVAMKMNFADLPDLVRLAHRYGCSEIFMLPLGGEELFTKVTGESLDGSPELVSSVLLESLQLGSRLNVALDVPPSFRRMMLDGPEQGRGLRGKALRLYRQWVLARLHFRANGFLRTLRRALGPPAPPARAKAGGSYCLMPWKDSYFASDGTVYPCCIMGEKLGNLNEQDWADIWNGSPYRNLRRTIHSWNPTAVCRYCPLPLGINGGDGKRHAKFFSAFRAEPVPIESDSVRFREGFFEIEYAEDGTPSHRWMGKEGRMAVAMRPGARFLRLRLIGRAPLPTAIPGFCQVNNLPEEPFDNTSDQLHLPLDGICDDHLDIRIRMEFDHLVEGDGRRLALAVRGVEFLF